MEKKRRRSFRGEAGRGERDGAGPVRLDGSGVGGGGREEEQFPVARRAGGEVEESGLQPATRRRRRRGRQPGDLGRLRGKRRVGMVPGGDQK